MKIYPFKEKFSSFFNELKESKQISIRCLKSPNGLKKNNDQDSINWIFRNHLDKKGFIYSERYKEICSLIPADIHWFWGAKKDNSYDVDGNIYLSSLSSSLHGSFNATKPEKGATGRHKFHFTEEKISPLSVNFGEEALGIIDKEHQSIWKESRFFYSNPDTQTFTCILQKQRPDEYFFDYDLDDLWLATGKELKMYHLDLDLAGFFDMLYLTKGCNLWEMLFVDDPANTVGDYEMDHVIRMLIALPHVFPEHDYSPLFKRFDDTFGKRIAVQPHYKEREHYQKLLAGFEKEAAKWK